MIKKVTIIGLGLIGGSIAKALKKSSLKIEISGIDNSEISQAALNEGSIDSAIGLNEIDKSDFIFICTPLNSAIKIMEDLAPLVKKSSIVTDVCGVKSILKKKWVSLRSEGCYVGGHPMTGKESGGYSNSDPLLFENSVYILTDEIDNLPNKIDFVKLIEALGARITIIDADTHDSIVSKVSHLPQILSVTLINTVSKENEKALDFAAGGFRDMTRIASSDFSVWEDIIDSNKEKILFEIDRLQTELNNMRVAIESMNTMEMKHKFETARKFRDEIPKNTKGFLTQLFDLFVFVTDEPGVISKISSALFEKNINIKDIELLKIREGTGGTFRISFESAEDAASAKVIINRIGYEVKSTE